MHDQKIILYHNPNCSKSRAVLHLLAENGQSPKVIEYLNQPLDRSALQAIMTKGIPAQALLRQGEVDLDVNSMDEDEIIDTICRQPALLQRPIIIFGDKAIIGRPPTIVLEFLE